MLKPNEQDQFDLLYMFHSIFEESTYLQVHGYILIGVDVASRYKVARPLRTKKASEVAFVSEAIYNRGGMFKYSKVFQCDNGPEFKRDVTKLHEKHNVDEASHTAFDEALKICWQRCCLNPWVLKNFKALKNYQQSGLDI